MMNKRKPRLVRAIDIPTAFALLTRLPAPLSPHHLTSRGARPAWAFSLVGVFVGGCSGGIGSAALAVGTGPMIACSLALGCGTVLTGALHEDGLADTADGLWGGWTVARRLEIMKDSRTGVYGLLALLFALLLRWSALMSLCETLPLWTVLAASGALSRAGMVALWCTLPPARPDGLAASIGRPDPATGVLCGGLGVVSAVLMIGSILAILTATLISAIPVAILGWIAWRRINGQTGDILGAVQQIGETALLIGFVICLT